MSETKKLIAELDEKVEQLLSKVKKQQVVLEQKLQEVEELNAKLTQNESRIKALTSENEVLKSAPLENKEDSDEMKARISELVKEIDNCISLLKV